MAQKPWERMEGESAKAFEAFRIYRDMGPERNLRAVAQQCNKSVSLLGRWSGANQWVERARAYDNELERAAHQEAVKSVREMRKRQLGIVAQMQHKAMSALQKMDTKSMKPKDQLAFLTKAMELEQKLRVQMVQDTTSADEKQAADNSLADVIVAAYQRRRQNEPDN